MFRIVLFFCGLFYLIKFSFELNEPRVIVDSVTFIGNYLNSWNNTKIISYRGIRYAQPPIENLRFKDPKPLFYNTTADYDATNNGNDCPSIYAKNPSEDCLFLNIYSSDDLSKVSSLKPVLVFIHPGGFYIGSSSNIYYGPEYLLTNNIVLVTFNYRLGTLGFLNLGTKDVPGNAGFKDQVIALRWIQRNIHNFGGNPRQITLMGYSAGAFSVSLHLVSPMSQSLFQRAVIMSGSIPPQMKIKTNQKYLARKQAKLMGCENANEPDEIIECLNKFNGSQIASTLRSMFDFGKDNPIFLWQPILEEDFGQERFLISDPYKLLQNGEFHKVPTLIGFTNNELCTSAADIIQNENLRVNFNENFSTISSLCFMYEDHKENVNLISEKLKKFYFSKEQITIENFSELCDIFSDSIIRFGTHRLADIISQYIPVFAYKFSYVGRHTNLEFAYENRKGAEHMDDLMYIFQNEEMKFSQTDPEATVVNIMINLITSFMKNDQPLQLYESYDFKSKKYIEINETIQIKEGRNFERTEIWDEIFPK